MEYLPIKEQPSYRFRCDLSGTEFSFWVRWIEANSAWLADISAESIEYETNGLFIMTGYDLLKGHGLQDFGSLICIDTQGDEDPEYDLFGDRWKLVYFEPGEITS